MKFLTKNSILLLIVWLTTAVSAWSQVPSRPEPPRLVNDLAGIFTPEQYAWLEDSLERFARNTSNQIAIVTMKSLGDLTPAEMATEIGQQWGVGGKKFDNGLVILIKPKDETPGEVFIAPGYGLEGAIPDIACSNIIRRNIIPEFKRGDYFAGVKAALDEILPLAAGEYSYKDEYEDENIGKGIVIAFILIVILLFIVISSIDQGNQNGNSGNNGGGGRRSSAGAFPIIFGTGLGSSGSGLSGGGFGGFGGFGGGGFGGGGAGGSW